MAKLSSADRSVSPPVMEIPREYNAAHDLVERNLAAGRGKKIAYIDDAGRYTYDDLAQRVNRAANALTGLGLEMEQRILIAHLDTIDWPSVFLGAIKAGIVPVAVNTLLTPADYEFMLKDSRARALVVSEQLLPNLAAGIKASPHLKHVIVSGKNPGSHLSLAALMDKAASTCEPAPTTSDDPCFWLYSSGSTGMPKGTVHVHSSAIQTAELYAGPILGIREEDVVFSAAKLFFAYGLGNALTFPMAFGATTVLMAERPTPDSVFKRLTEHKPTIFYGVPTLYAALLASPALPKRADVTLRVCTSAGEALPADIGKRWTEHFGVEILDGIGSTEMLHIFLSNRPGEVRYGTTGKPVPGYAIRLIDENGAPAKQGELGELQIAGPTSAAMYWNNRAKSRDTFIGEWTRSGDKYTADGDGYYTYGGRSDDMLKVSGIYVSPFEVEAALLTHADVLEAAVIGVPDEQALIKPKAFVVAKEGVKPSAQLGDALKQHVKDRLAPYKYPRWVEFVPELPKTATGKIQRFKLRALEERAGK
ncbi:MAG: benzoate-CoA ligase family protein [Betaproteobacteria bacterium]|nr:benzoate-CoA ligase family protein [Betaproteobacteria bacterium]